MKSRSSMPCLVSRFLLAAALTAGACGGGSQASKAPAAGAAAPPKGIPPGTVTLKEGNPCSVLHPLEVEQIIGLPIPMREVADESTCNFPFGSAPTAAGAGRAGEGSPEELAKSMAAPMAGGPGRVSIKIHWDKGPTAIMAARMASKLLGSDAGFQRLDGIGDEAWLGPMASTLLFAKGKMGVEIDLRMVPDAREKGIRLAKLIASRLP